MHVDLEFDACTGPHHRLSSVHNWRSVIPYLAPLLQKAHQILFLSPSEHSSPEQSKVSTPNVLAISAIKSVLMYAFSVDGVREADKPDFFLFNFLALM